jgi:alpha-mannosidase
LILELDPFAIRAFAAELEKPASPLEPPSSRPVALVYDCKASTQQGEANRRGFDGKGNSYPSELLPSKLAWGGVDFELGPVSGQKPNALVCQGQIVSLPEHSWQRVHCLVASANGPRQGMLRAGRHQLEFDLPHFSGLLGRWNRNALDSDPVGSANDIHQYRVAWIGSHRHGPLGEDQPYVFCYLFEVSMEIEPGCTELMLPDDESIHVFAISLSDGRIAQTTPASRFYD